MVQPWPRVIDSSPLCLEATGSYLDTFSDYNKFTSVSSFYFNIDISVHFAKCY